MVKFDKCSRQIQVYYNGEYSCCDCDADATYTVVPRSVFVVLL